MAAAIYLLTMENTISILSGKIVHLISFVLRAELAVLVSLCVIWGMNEKTMFSASLQPCFCIPPPPGTRCRATIILCWMKSWLIGLLLMNLPYLPFPFSYRCYNCVCVCTSACVSTHTYIHVSVHTCAYLATVGYVPKFRRVFYQMSSFSKSRPLEDQIWGFYGIFYALWIVY